MTPGLIAIIAAVLGFVAIAGVGFAFAGGTPSQAKALKRVQSLGGGTSAREARARARAAVANPDARRKQIVSTLKEQERQQKRTRLTHSSILPAPCWGSWSR